MSFELNENRDEEYYEVGDFVQNQQESDEDKDEDAEDAVNSPVKLKRRGRPLGSKNKKRI